MANVDSKASRTHARAPSKLCLVKEIIGKTAWLVGIGYYARERELYAYCRTASWIVGQTLDGTCEAPSGQRPEKPV
jgi:hypothetical protein